MGMRIVCTAMGAALVPLRYFNVWALPLINGFEWIKYLIDSRAIVLNLYFIYFFSYLTVWEMTESLTASCIAGALMLFDVGVLILNRYILLDPILLFFISFATYSMAKFRNCSNSPFSQVEVYINCNVN